MTAAKVGAGRTAMMPVRAQWVDYARGIGIVLVVYGHVARGVHSAGLPIDEGWFRLVDSVIYSFHMPLFFFLSGLYFLASMQRHGAGGLLVEKLRTVAWPYLVWSVLQGLTEVLLANATGATNGKVTLAEVASLLWQPRAQFWFLYALFFMSLAALPFYRFLSARWYPFVTIAACLAFLGAAYLPGGVPVTYLIQNGPYFTLGVLLGHVVGAQRPLPLSGLLATAGLAIAVGFQWLFHGPLALSYTQGGGGKGTTAGAGNDDHAGCRAAVHVVGTLQPGLARCAWSCIHGYLRDAHSRR